ncbi:hypothetical protein N9O21_06065 [Rhodobacteraceae bacterium]|nr:hypothetical protein [Paracoccaceae bacterium]
MVEPANPDLSIGKQYALLSITRSSFYYQPKGETVLNLMLMRQIDEQFLETPFFGVRQMTWHLRNEGLLVNEKRIRPFIISETRTPTYHLQHAFDGPRRVATPDTTHYMRLPHNSLILLRDLNSQNCLASAPAGQVLGFEQRRITGSSKPLWSEDEQDIRNVEVRR